MLLETRYDLFTHFTDHDVTTEHPVFEGPLSVSYTRHHTLSWQPAFTVRVELPVAYTSPQVRLGPERVGLTVGKPGTDELTHITDRLRMARESQQGHIDAYINEIEAARTAWQAHETLLDQIRTGAAALQAATQASRPGVREKWVGHLEASLNAIATTLEPAPVDMPYGLLFENSLKVLQYLEHELNDTTYAERMLRVARDGHVTTRAPIRSVRYVGPLETKHIARELLMGATYEHSP